MRIDTALYSERSNAMTMLDGIGRTLQRATCADPSLISTLNGYLTAARAGVTQGTNAGYTTAVARLHDFAIAANNGGIAGQFSGCLVAANYQGTFVVRAINSAFTVFDRLLHPLPTRCRLRRFRAAAPGVLLPAEQHQPAAHGAADGPGDVNRDR